MLTLLGEARAEMVKRQPLPLLDFAWPDVRVGVEVQGQIMQPLSEKEAEQLTSLLAKLVAGHVETAKTGINVGEIS